MLRPGPSSARPAGVLEVAPATLAIGALALAAVLAGPLTAYLEAAAAQLYDSSGYVAAVLGTGPEG